MRPKRIVIAALLGAGVGISEILPIKFGPLAKTLEQTGSLGRLKRIFAAGGLEALQEAAANTAQNLIENKLVELQSRTWYI